MTPKALLRNVTAFLSALHVGDIVRVFVELDHRDNPVWTFEVSKQPTDPNHVVAVVRRDVEGYDAPRTYYLTTRDASSTASSAARSSCCRTA